MGEELIELGRYCSHNKILPVKKVKYGNKI